MIQIPENQMIVVSGDPRSGTSLMMQTLNLLEIPISGEKFTQRRGSEPMNEIAVNLNPKGFFEVPGVVMRGTPDIKEFGGTAIKIISPGLTKTPTNLIYKVILCLRDPRFVAESQTNLQNGVLLDSNPFKTAISPKRYIIEMGKFLKWLMGQPQDFRDKFLIVDYNNFLKDTENELDRLISYLGVTVTSAVRRKAIKNVDQSLRRSDAAFSGWGEKYADYGNTADLIYQSLKTFDPDQSLDASSRVDTVIETESKEMALIFKPEMCCNVSATFLRQYGKSEKTKNYMLKSYLHRVKIGESFLTSPDYTGESEEIYTIHLPIDIGGSQTFNKVWYLGLQLTNEEAQAMHELRRRDGIKTTDSAKAKAIKARYLNVI